MNNLIIYIHALIITFTGFIKYIYIFAIYFLFCFALIAVSIQN